MNPLREAAQQALEALLTYEQYIQPLTNYFGGPTVPKEGSASAKVDAAIAALRAALAQQAEPVQQVKTCAWRDNLDAIYETECGNLHIVNDGTLEENGMRYCCYCGKEIKDESPT